MKQLRLSTVVVILVLAAAPALAGGIAFDLPRLDFPAPQPDTTRDCQTLTTPSGTCAPTTR